jgi:prepilin-type processing-associated H-X9-DG protein
LILLGDAPEVIGNVDMFNGHEGTGINVCYTDGHVAFRRFSAKQPRQTVGGKQFVLMTEWTGGDYPFRNLEGRLAPGLTIHDASLGPSASEPQ